MLHPLFCERIQRAVARRSRVEVSAYAGRVSSVSRGAAMRRDDRHVALRRGRAHGVADLDRNAVDAGRGKRRLHR